MYQARACEYAAMASSRSSEQPWSGLEYEPHSTTARGAGPRLYAAAGRRRALRQQAVAGA